MRIGTSEMVRLGVREGSVRGEKKGEGNGPGEDFANVAIGEMSREL